MVGSVTSGRRASSNILTIRGEEVVVWVSSARLYVCSHKTKRFIVALKYAEEETYRSWLTDKTQTLSFQAASSYANTKRDWRRLASCFFEAMASSGSGSLLKYTVVISA